MSLKNALKFVNKCAGLHQPKVRHFGCKNVQWK